MRKPRHIPSIALIVMGICLMLGASLIAQQASPALQHITLAPALAEEKKDDETVRSNQPLQDLLRDYETLREESGAYASHMSIMGTMPDTDFINDEQRKLAGSLIAIGEDHFSIYPRTLVSGRLPYADELRDGDRVALIDEQLTLLLYRNSQPLGRPLILNEIEYRIIGVLRQGSRIGEVSEYHAYVPITQLAREQLPLQTLTISALPIPGAGAFTAFDAAVKGWHAGDTMDLGKEAMRAWLPARALLFLVGLMLALWGLRWWKLLVGRQIHVLKVLHETEYLLRLLPRIIRLILMATLSFACIIGGMYLLILFLVQPVYTFTEWVPAVLVEWVEVTKTFWVNQTNAAKAISLRSPELLQ
ncbi:ABC transporter permease, partial [Eubacteriales bacterium OttesenSCG-928-N13]|nr:ABC transporter permease [Eubacteriales bacterium OttesenSCG-928-N13]